jgi:hypothetical protein
MKLSLPHFIHMRMGSVKWLLTFSLNIESGTTPLS